MTEWATRYNFAKVSREVGLRPPVKGCRHGHGPRLHDMRHRFAARTLVDWYRAGVDVEREIPKLATYLGHVHVNDTYWYIEAVPELLELATRRLESREGGEAMTSNTNFPALVQAFFTDRLLRQRKASPHTIAGYRDSFRLLLRFAAKRFAKEPSKLSLEDLDAPFIGEFLDHLEKERHNSARTRNTRLAAIHSFFRYVSFQEPGCADLCRRILAIPSKRYERKPIEYLTS